MQIAHVPSGAEYPSVLGRSADLLEATQRDTDKASESKRTSGIASTSAAREVLSGYDVTEITPTEFSTMIQELFEAGVITPQELQILTAVRHDLDMEGIEAGRPIDLQEFYTRMLERAQRDTEDADDPSASHQQIRSILQRLDWIQKFALVQASPNEIGLDMLA